MDEQPRKRRGPLIWLASRSRRFWIVLAILLPFIYVLGSGPTRSIAFRNRMTYTTPPGAVRPALYATSEQSALWWIFYFPLAWASQQSWGQPIRSYWALFPIPTIVERP
jgi:hypothetical protein